MCYTTTEYLSLMILVGKVNYSIEDKYTLTLPLRALKPCFSDSEIT